MMMDRVFTVWLSVGCAGMILLSGHLPSFTEACAAHLISKVGLILTNSASVETIVNCTVNNGPTPATCNCKAPTFCSASCVIAVLEFDLVDTAATGQHCENMMGSSTCGRPTVAARSDAKNVAMMVDVLRPCGTGATRTISLYATYAAGKPQGQILDCFLTNN